jgi:hypothetical protein
MKNNFSLAEAKQRIRIPDLWRHFGFDGEPKTSCKSPFRKDRRPSFSVNAAGDLWNDFATAECGDTVAFFQRATGLSQKEACRKFIELAGGRLTQTPPAAQTPQAEPPRIKPTFPDVSKGTPAELLRLSSLRNVSADALALAQVRGLLWFATLKGFPAWIVTDSARLNAQARRLDGKLWEHLDGHPKAWTLFGSWAAWPVGIKEAQPFPAIALVEGTPDLLAACHFILCESRELDCAPVAIFGATQRIHADALPLFAGKRIRIFGHADNDGREGVERWARQLEAVGAVVDAFDFEGLRKTDESPVKDLNDCCHIHADDFENERTLWNLMP